MILLTSSPKIRPLEWVTEEILAMKRKAFRLCARLLACIRPVLAPPGSKP